MSPGEADFAAGFEAHKRLVLLEIERLDAEVRAANTHRGRVNVNGEERSALLREATRRILQVKAG